MPKGKKIKTETMDESREVSLQALQMEDLGTARREKISTVDLNNPFRSVSLRQIEAARLSNADPSVRRIVDQNKESIRAWTTLHQTVEDTGDLEKLESLMDGQSHRAQLTAAIQERGGQTYVAPAKPKGRSTSSFASPQGRKRAMPMGRHAVESPRKFSLDPSLDLTKKSRPYQKYLKGHKSIPTAAKPPELKVRRPAVPGQDFSAKLADPGEFLAACQALQAAQKSPQNPYVGQTLGEDRHASEALREAVVIHDLSLSGSRWAASDIASAEQHELASSIADAKQSANNGDTEDSRVENADSPTSHPCEIPGIQKPSPDSTSSQPMEISSSCAQSKASKSSLSGISQASQPQPHLRDLEECETDSGLEDGEIESELEESEIDETVDHDNGLLLDLAATSDVTMTSPKSSGEQILSPALRDLIDLKFCGASPETSPTTSHVKPQETKIAEELAEASAATESQPATPKRKAGNVSIIRYLRELSFLNDTLENLGDDEAGDLKNRRDFLEKYIAEATRFDPRARAASTYSQGTPTPRAPAPSMEASRDVSRDSTRIVLEQAVTVPPFIPRSLSDNFEHRSTAQSASTTSPTADNTRESHIYPPGLESKGSPTSPNDSVGRQSLLFRDKSLEDLCRILTDKLSLRTGAKVPLEAPDVGAGTGNVCPSSILSKSPSRSLFASKYAVYPEKS